MDRYFWESLGNFGDGTALIDASESMTYARLKKSVETGRRTLRYHHNRLIFLFANNDVGAVLCYLSALAAGQPIHLAKGAVQWGACGELLEKYRPDILLWKGNAGALPPHYVMAEDFHGYSRADYQSIQDSVGDGAALLLSTSGSMGSPKLVRLSRGNIAAAAGQVAKALRLTASRRAITSLPLNFVYGLSVLHAHLHAGASVILTGRSVQDRAFWRLLDDAGATSLAAVPWTLRMMRGIGFDPVRHPSLRDISLSGGALEPTLSSWLQDLAAQGLDIFSMYGQTETSGRMCVLPPEAFLSKPGSVGLPVQGAGVTCGPDGAITFRGPNVMQAYATAREDLAGPDECQGTIMTGDSGYLDQDGYLYVTGRLSRIAKLLGMRIDLDEIQACLDGAAAVDADDHALYVFVENEAPSGLEERLAALLKRLRVPSHCAQIHVLAQLPRNEAGKIRYATLRESVAARPRL
jgi:acyl-coenzyme A synthetase/AMP-(fatty) acid ligase